MRSYQPKMGSDRFFVGRFFSVGATRGQARRKRVDPLWEQIGRSGSRLFERALKLLE
jgi:hypothetical protein